MLKLTIPQSNLHRAGQLKMFREALHRFVIEMLSTLSQLNE